MPPNDAPPPPVSRPSTSVTSRRRPCRSYESWPGSAVATASSRPRCVSSAYVSPRPRRPASVCSSTIARRAYGWWTPTTLSSGGSSNATGVTTTREMRLRLTRGSPGRLHGEDRHVEVEQQSLRVAAGDELADRRAAAHPDDDQPRGRGSGDLGEGLDDVVAVVGLVDASRHAGRGGPGDQLV